jgi:uncharacterized membrane protein
MTELAQQNRQSAREDVTLEELRSVPLFASLDDAAAFELRELLQARDVEGGAPIFRAGESGDAMYLIESGRVCISVRDAAGHDVTLAELAQGDFFGEMAILDGQPRSADAKTLEDSRLAVLSREDFIAFVRQNPNVALEMLAALTMRLRQTDEMLRQRVSRNANEEAEARFTKADRVAFSLANFGGSWKFIAFLSALIIGWMVLNTWVLPKPQFDEFPYQLLGLLLGVIAGLQAPVIMMSQNRQGEQDRLRADLDYQVNLKNEISLAEILRRLDVLESERLPILFEEQNKAITQAAQKKQE